MVVVVVAEVVVLLFFSECQAEALLVPAPTPGNLIATDSFLQPLSLSLSTCSNLSPSLFRIIAYYLVEGASRVGIARRSVVFVYCDSFLTTRLSRELNRIPASCRVFPGR